MANGWGGAREGAGRKPKVIVHRKTVATAESLIADVLPQIVDRLIALAMEGGEEVTEVYQAAGTIALGNGARPDQPFLNGSGSNKHELILVERRVKRSGPDKAAMEYLIDRILGLRSVLQPEEDEGEAGAGPGRVLIYVPDNNRGPKKAVGE